MMTTRPWTGASRVDTRTENIARDRAEEQASPGTLRGREGDDVGRALRRRRRRGRNRRRRRTCGSRHGDGGGAPGRGVERHWLRPVRASGGSPGARRPEAHEYFAPAEGLGRRVEEGRPAHGVVVEDRRRRGRRRSGRGGSSSSSSSRRRRRRRCFRADAVERGGGAADASQPPSRRRQDLPEPLHRRPRSDSAERGVQDSCCCCC